MADKQFLDGKRRGGGKDPFAEASTMEEELIATIEWSRPFSSQTPKDAVSL